MSVVCMKLDYVPGLSNEETMSFKTWLQQNKTKGANNVPRRFGDGKNVKCTVVLQGAFSKETKSLLDVGEYCASVFLIIKNMISLFQLFMVLKTNQPIQTLYSHLSCRAATASIQLPIVWG